MNENIYTKMQLSRPMEKIIEISIYEIQSSNDRLTIKGALFLSQEQRLCPKHSYKKFFLTKIERKYKLYL